MTQKVRQRSDYSQIFFASLLLITKWTLLAFVFPRQCKEEDYGSMFCRKTRRKKNVFFFCTLIFKVNSEVVTIFLRTILTTQRIFINRKTNLRNKETITDLEQVFHKQADVIFFSCFFQGQFCISEMNLLEYSRGLDFQYLNNES